MKINSNIQNSYNITEIKSFLNIYNIKYNFIIENNICFLIIYFEDVFDKKIFKKFLKRKSINLKK